MKKLILIALLFPFIAKAQFTIVNTSTTSLVEVRSGTWPLNLQRIIKESDTAYVLEFRDQGYTNDVVMTSLRFPNLEQVRYFQKGLTALRTGSNGDIAKFKDYSIKRVDVKREGVYYILNCSAGATTDFQQPDADKLITAIQKL
ncbi:MAG TPA: hypothetical protein VMI35_13030 [Puia sp.]|nr:hypothetical protein [Puia sp.]